MSSPGRAHLLSRRTRRRGFSLVELLVVALLVTLLMLIAGQIFVELIRRQAGFGAELAATEGLAPFDSFLIRDAREATDSLLSTPDGKFEKSDRVLILALPEEKPGERRTAVWELGKESGATRILLLNDTEKARHSFKTAGIVQYLEYDDVGRRQLEIRAVPYLDPDPAKRPAPELCRLATYRNLW